MTARPTIAPMVSIYDGRECIGFVIARGRIGFEAFNADLDSLGTFPTQREAANAIPNNEEDKKCS
jgi:hypothetical protein